MRDVQEELDEVYKLYPREYEWQDGKFLGDDWAGQQVPVPPTWVRQRLTLPTGCDKACLARELSEIYPSEARSTLIDYLKNWRRVREQGLHLLIAGSGVTYKRRQWAASAVLNELTMRFGQTQDMSSEWMSTGNVRQIVATKSARFDTYSSLRARLMSTTMLFVEDPLKINPQSDERWFLEDIYKARADRLLPTITTMNADPADLDFRGVKALLGDTIAETFQIYAKWIVAL